ncbi:MAG: hypothetical protein E6K72_06695 [Candidatus Eisenbacteria bacterium]|uniref:Translocation/assembly module TamB n=1 Tax=Eiseniibacteriota bacterium TaxID=2212470 RepID=A0A538SV43_UNCEI|nr:MAG: hypothetical protein E6K72_06695 [Candidatus Eisenbacteria bacterium]
MFGRPSTVRRAARGAVAAWIVAFVAAHGAQAIDDPGCGVVAVATREGARAYVLPHSFIRPGSDSVWTRAGPLARGVDYELDLLHGQIRLQRVALPGDTLWFAGCWLVAPPPLTLKLMRYRPLALAAPDSEPAAASPVHQRPAVQRDPTEAPAGASLNISGNKTIAVEFGSAQDAFLRQSLDLAISGTLAPGVLLTGVLSDRNTPLTASGSTRDLQSLDRVRIELKTPQGSAALGDVSLQLSQGEFGRLERRLQGVRGDVGIAGFQGTAAAASAQGVYQRVEFFGVEGRQGPYTLRSQDGAVGIAVVIGSEVVMLDGARMTRGEGADYAIDYERAEITFSNRRPISSASRIMVECQFTVNRFRRNLAAFDGRWQGRVLHAFTRVLSEADDGGRPLDIDLSAADRLVLEFAGDSANRAIAPGVTPGGGDYDSVRVAGGTLAYAYAGPDSGRFGVSFARVGAGRGDYADSALASGRTAYRYVGPRFGAYVVGRALPAPETHRLWVVGGGATVGALTIDAEGAVSHHDLNALSSLDDGDNMGLAGRAAIGLGGTLPGVMGEAGLSFSARTVGPRFVPFSRLERPFAQEDWGLPLDADLEHQQRVEAAGHWKPRRLGELRASLARLELPSGFESVRRTAEWSRDGILSFAGAIEHADANDPARVFPHGGRDRSRVEARLLLPWLEPALRAQSDERRTPSDTARAGDRVRESELELASPQRFGWRTRAGYGVRDDATLLGRAFVELREVRTLRVTLDTPSGRALVAGLALNRREVEPRADPVHTRSDLGSVHLALDDAKRALSGSVNLEVTSEGENRRTRTLTFVGGGRGGYDALGSPALQGDYLLGDGTSGAALDLLARSALSARLGWQFGSSDAWRGSRLEFAFETDARRRGPFVPSDAVIAPAVVLGDPALARGSVLQRLETDLAPGARAGALHLLAERRVTADRSYENFAQTSVREALEARLRARPAPAFSAEISSRLKRDEEAQTFMGASAFRRVLIESGGGAQLVFTPSARVRAAGIADGAWVRPEGGTEYTRTIRLGPDLGIAVLARGRLEIGARRTFIRGPAVATYLPGSDPLGTPLWEGTSRFDYRLHESTTFGLSVALRDVPHRAPLATGRAELRAFF